MSAAQIVLISLLLMSLYWISYYWTRRRILKQVRYNHVFYLANLLFVLVIILGFQPWLVIHLNIGSRLLIVMTVIMTVAALMHHLSVLAYKKALRHPFIEKIHGPISHILFFVPYSVNSLILGLALGASSKTQLDILLVSLFIVVSIGGSIAGIMVGINVGRANRLTK
jgi:hypothetical protein